MLLVPPIKTLTLTRCNGVTTSNIHCIDKLWGFPSAGKVATPGSLLRLLLRICLVFVNVRFEDKAVGHFHFNGNQPMAAQQPSWLFNYRPS